MALSSIIEPQLALLSTKEDLSIFRKEVDELKRENSLLREEVSALKDGFRRTEGKIEELDILHRKNNLIIKGLTPQHEDNLEVFVSKFFSDVLKVNISPDSLYVRPLGRRDKAPLIAKFSRLQDRWTVANATKILKGTGFSVNEDLPFESRLKKGKLLQLRREILRRSPQERVTVRGSTLFVGGLPFTWAKHGGVLHGGEDGSHRLSEVLHFNVADLIRDLVSRSSSDRPGQVSSAAAPPSHPSVKKSS